MACLRGAVSSLQSTLPSSRLWTGRASHAATNDTHCNNPAKSASYGMLSNSCLHDTHKEQPSAPRRANERTYPELLNSPRCRLVVLALEVGGRWSEEAAQSLRLLARCRAREIPPALRANVTSAWVARWSALLSFAAARAFAASLLSFSRLQAQPTLMA